MSYTPNAHFADPARSAPELWRIPAAAAIMLAGSIGLQALLMLFAGAIWGESGMIFISKAIGGSETGRGATLLLLATFGFYLAGLALALRAIHQRGLRSLLGDTSVLASDAIRVTGACVLLLAALTLALPSPLETIRNAAMPAGQWILTLALAVPLIALQSGTEEAFFRGYLQQQLAARFKHIGVALIVPSVLFALAHTTGDAGANMWLFTLWAGAFGLAAADLTARTGSIGAAIGLHFANNLIAFLLVAPIGQGSGLALWHLQMDISDPSFQKLWPAEFGSIFCLWLAARVALRV